jgi:hypothetical protein
MAFLKSNFLKISGRSLNGCGKKIQDREHAILNFFERNVHNFCVSFVKTIIFNFVALACLFKRSEIMLTSVSGLSAHTITRRNDGHLACEIPIHFLR